MHTLHLFFQGRSKSLTSIDALNPNGKARAGNGLSAMEIDLDSRSDCGRGGVTDRLAVPIRCESVGGNGPVSGSPRGYQRRRKLSTAGKVSSSEFLTVNFESLDGASVGDRGPEEFMPATRGTCLR